MKIICPNCGRTIETDKALKTCPTCKKEISLDEETIEIKEPKLEGLPPKMKAFLEVLSGNDAGIIHEIKKSQTVIGRKDGDIIVSDPLISKKHAAVEIWSREVIYIKDLESTNGTYINGIPISQTRLKNGDVIQLGNIKLKFKVELY